jgi:hypothetical protein
MRDGKPPAGHGFGGREWLNRPPPYGIPPPAPTFGRRRCRSSVVEHPLGKGEVHSSILCGSTSPSNRIGTSRQLPLWANRRSRHSVKAFAMNATEPPGEARGGARVLFVAAMATIAPVMGMKNWPHAPGICRILAWAQGAQIVVCHPCRRYTAMPSLEMPFNLCSLPRSTAGSAARPRMADLQLKG